MVLSQNKSFFIHLKITSLNVKATQKLGIETVDIYSNDSLSQIANFLSCLKVNFETQDVSGNFKINLELSEDASA